MPARLVNIDHDTALLQPPDLRQWVPADHLVHFRRDAVGELELRGVRVNERGTGDAQYPPRLLLGLLLYSYATGVFASRQIERSEIDCRRQPAGWRRRPPSNRSPRASPRRAGAP